jgi:uncharacterized spore protein YtfJ
MYNNFITFKKYINIVITLETTRRNCLNIGDPIKTTVEEIRKVLNVDNVVGETIESDDKLLIPVTKMGMGFGSGMGEGKAQNNMAGSGAGAGGAAGIEPLAVIVVYKNIKGPEGVKVMSLKAPDRLSRALGEIGNAAVEIIEHGSKMMSCQDNKKKNAKFESKEGEAKFESNK